MYYYVFLFLFICVCKIAFCICWLTAFCCDCELFTFFEWFSRSAIKNGQNCNYMSLFFTFQHFACQRHQVFFIGFTTEMKLQHQHKVTLLLGQYHLHDQLQPSSSAATTTCMQQQSVLGSQSHTHPVSHSFIQSFSQWIVKAITIPKS